MGYELIWEPRCLVRRFVGRVTGAEVVASLCEASADPRLDGIAACIADYSAAECLVVTESDAAMIAALHIGARSTLPDLVTVGVATDPGVVAEIRRVEAAFRPQIEVILVANLAEARGRVVSANALARDAGGGRRRRAW